MLIIPNWLAYVSLDTGQSVGTDTAIQLQEMLELCSIRQIQMHVQVELRAADGR
jgi:hypothetical protein